MPDGHLPHQLHNSRGIGLDYETLLREPVATDPFPHLVVRNFVPPDLLRQVIHTLPPIAGGGSYPAPSLRLQGAAKALVEELESATLRDAVARRFGLDLADSLTMLTIRGRTRGKDGRIHRDSTSKLVTILLYLNPDGSDWSSREGCLRLLRGPDDIEDFTVEVPPVDGTLLVFPNGPTTFHGHRPFVGKRYAIQLNYMASGAGARRELRRHRLSALVKRFLPA